MSETPKPPPSPGTIGWFDLTVADAPKVRDFYQGVAGWEAHPIDMGGYSDFAVGPPGGDPVAGVCHARGANASQPPVWMIYITVADLDASVRRAVELGGKVLVPAKTVGKARYCVVQDPAGAAAALYQP